MKNRIQKLPSALFIGDQNAKSIKLFWYDKDGVRHTKSDYFKTELDAFRYVAECAKKGIAAYASAYIEEDQQAEVFTFSEVGQLENFIYSRPVIQSIERAKKLVFKGNIPDVSQAIVPAEKKETIIQVQTISKKEEPKYHVVWVWYPDQDREKTHPYSFKCRRGHDLKDPEKKDYVVVMSGGRPVNAEVADYKLMTQSEITEMAKEFRRNDIYWVESDDPM